MQIVLNSFYFIIVTTFTVGYGYYHPTSDASKLFAIFLILFGTTIIVSFLVTFSTTVVRGACDELILQILRWRGAIKPPQDKHMSRYRSLFSVCLLIITGLVGMLVMRYSITTYYNILTKFYKFVTFIL